MSNFSKVRYVKCSICGLELRANNLWRHLKRHSENPDSFNKTKITDLHCQYCNKLCKNLNSLWHHEHLCKENPNKDNCKLKNQNWRRGLSAKVDERIRHNAEAIKKYYKTHCSPFKHKHHTEETKRILREKQLNVVHLDNSRNTWSKKGYYNNIFFMSTWELAYYIYMTDNNHKVEKCTRNFTYVYNSCEHKYTPDFILDDNIIVEIKGRENDIDKTKYASVKNLKVLYRKDIEHMIEYVKVKYNIRNLESLYE